uniref:Purple acid phosphatase n=1 Tax=Lolium multiflorum TaxID=4521 RepID=A5JQI7_LOLMU|nr:purple acid phosphatase [Lolium multiflorum]
MGVVNRIGAAAAACAVLLLAVACHAGQTSEYRRQLGQAMDMPIDADVFRPPPGRNAPQQVHITQGDHDGTAMIISWVTTIEPGSSTVLYGASEDSLNCSAKGKHTQYTFYNYTSGYIHHSTIKKLEFDTKYYYAVGTGETRRKFWFRTPPKSGPDVPYTFGPLGDLGQSFDSNVALAHYETNTKAQAVLFVGDLTYADNYPYHDNTRWDTWARFVERNLAYQPWIWTAGNHEIDFAPELGETKPLQPFSQRYPTPYIGFWQYSTFLVFHLKSLCLCHCFGIILPHNGNILLQYKVGLEAEFFPYKWLEAEFPKVNRSETPWLIVLMHAPWYNSYNYHYMEGESMRVMYEPWFVKYKVDLVFAGHVHAYERTHRISNVAYLPGRPLGQVYSTRNRES